MRSSLFFFEDFLGGGVGAAVGVGVGSGDGSGVGLGVVFLNPWLLETT